VHLVAKSSTSLFGNLLAHEAHEPDAGSLIETNAPVVWREQDAAQLREAADEIERLHKALSGLVRYLES
jgi:hypothetical protein